MLKSTPATGQQEGLSKDVVRMDERKESIMLVGTCKTEA